MARFGAGMPGGFNLGDMQKLMKQAQKMQEDAEQLEKDMQDARVDAQAGGGMVTVTVNGHGHLVSIKIKPEVIQLGDVELLEDLIITAAKEAADTAQNTQKESMEKITGALGDLNLPPGLLG